MMNRLICSQLRTVSSFINKDVASVVPILESLLSPKQVNCTKPVRDQHSRDESYHKVGVPDVVVFPKNVEEVSAVVRVCNDRYIPVVPFGTGTGLEGGIAAYTGGVSIDLMGIDEIVAVHAEDFDCTVQPGVTRKKLNAYLRDSGLWFPVDPGADASLCGMCATSASGTNAVRYGTMRENVLNLQVVLANGQVIHTRGVGRRARKSAAGYNLTNLFVGSEGTLGIITEATLKLYGIPEKISSAVTCFETVQKAVDAVVQILQSCIPVARIEFLDDVQMDACNKYSKLNYPLKQTIFLEFHGSESEVKAQAETAGEICRYNEGGAFEWSANEKEREVLWKARHDAYYAALALRSNSRGFITDVCVPISKLPYVLTETKNDVLHSGLVGPIVGHVGDGNFHVILLVDDKNEAETKEAQRLSDIFVKRALQVGGTCTGEHGVGDGKKQYLGVELGDDTVALMRSIKVALDPRNILNPGKVLP